jgi:hypothetical protein
MVSVKNAPLTVWLNLRADAKRRGRRRGTGRFGG